MTETKEIYSIIDLVRTVYSRREDLKEQREALAIRRAEFDAANKDLLEDIERFGYALAEAEEELRDATLTAYRETGDKAPGPGVGIRVIVTLDYSPSWALNWAVEHKMTAMLTVDKKMFEAVIEIGAVEDSSEMVTIIPKATATIATDLAKALGESAE